jgi:hypothetical protein
MAGDLRTCSGTLQRFEEHIIMRGLFTNQALAIQPGQAVSGIADGMQTLRIARGLAWLTVEGESHDYWLRCGESFTPTPGRLIVIEADSNGGKLDITIVRNASVATKLGARLRMLIQGFATRGKAKAELPPCCSHSV